MSPDGAYQAGVEYRTRALPARLPVSVAGLSYGGPVAEARPAGVFWAAGSGIGAGGTIAAEVIEVRSEDDASLRLGAAQLRAELNGLTPGETPPADVDESPLLLAYLRERAQNGLLDPVLFVPALASTEGSR